jgi:hypothetical protein
MLLVVVAAVDAEVEWLARRLYGAALLVGRLVVRFGITGSGNERH